jgi:hypothetical protein
MCKKMPVIPVYRVVDMKRIIRKNGGLRRRRSPKKLINFTRDSIQSAVAENKMYYLLYVGKFIISLNNLKLKFNGFLQTKNNYVCR